MIIVDTGFFVALGNRVRIPKLGWVKLTESLRFSGKILSATVSGVADKWFISLSVQMETTPVKESENQALASVGWVERQRNPPFL